MNYIKFTDFRNHSKEYFDKIEHGDSFVIIRKGQPIAHITPFSDKPAGWKRKVNKVKLKNDIDSSEYIFNERTEK